MISKKHEALKLAAYLLLFCTVVFLILKGDSLERARIALDRGDNMPAHIDIDGTDWNALRVDEIGPNNPAGMVLGLTDCVHRVIYIRIQPKKYQFEDERLVLFHELMHAMVCNSKGEPDNMAYNSHSADAHEGIHFTTYQFADLFRRNPGLGAYLGRG